MHQPISEPTLSFEHMQQGQQSSRELMRDDPDQQGCFFCAGGDPLYSDLTSLIPEALFSKYASSQNYFYTKELNEIVEDGLSLQCARYRQNLMLDDDEEYLKREYQQHEYDRKIAMLSEYYKFHKDFPRFYGMPIELAMNKYHDNRRDFDYRRIRKMLKDQQKMEFDDPDPSEMSDSIINHSSYVKKSRYSTMLLALQEELDKSRRGNHDESDALLETLEKLDAIVKKTTSKFPNSRLRLVRNMNDEASIQRNRFDTFLRKVDTKAVPKLRLEFNRKAAPISTSKSPSVKLDFRKKKPQKTQDKILLPTRRQDENQMRRSSYNSLALQLPTKSINLATPGKKPLSGRPLPVSSNQNCDTLKRFSVNSKEIFESVKSTATIKPLMKNLELMNSLDFASSKIKRTRREKSIQKIYGVKMRSVSMGTTDRTQPNNPPVSSHKKSRATVVESGKKSSKSTHNLRQYRSSEYSKPESMNRSPSNSLHKGNARSSKLSLTSSKKALPKLETGLHNYTAISKELKKFDSIFSSSKHDKKDTVDRMLEKKMKVEPSRNFQRLRSLI